MYFILFMKSTKMNHNSESIWKTASKAVLISKFDSVTFAELVIVSFFSEFSQKYRVKRV